MVNLDGRKDKEKISKIVMTLRRLTSHSKVQLINSDGHNQTISTLPWLLTHQKSKHVKEVIKKLKFPIKFFSSIKNIITNKGELGGVKTHEWHTLIKVIIFVCIFILYIGETSC